MNFDNLFALECNIRYDQDKLQSILKTFQQQIQQMQLQINAIDRRCQHLELTDTTTDKKFGKFESFTIDNLRSSVDQFSSLNSTVSNYLRKDPSQYEQQQSIIIPSDPKQYFEDKLIQYSKQTQEIANHKLVKTQISFIGNFLNNQPSKIQSNITQKQTQFELMTEEVKNLINQKFQQFKQELTKQKKVTFNGVQNLSNKYAGGHRPSVADKLIQIQKEKDSFKYDNPSVERPSMLDLLDGETVSDMSHQNFGKLQSNMEFQDVKNDDDIMSKKNKNNSQKPPASGQELKEQISKIKETLNKGFLGNSVQKNQSQMHDQNQDKIKQAESFSLSAVEALTIKIKQQIRELVQQQVNKITHDMSQMTLKHELSQNNMTFLMKQFRLYKDDLEKLFDKYAQIDDKLQNIISNNNDKFMNLTGRIREQELKINQIEICSFNQNSFKHSDTGHQNSSETRKFKEISNFKKTSQFDPVSVSLNTTSNLRISHVKNSSSTPSLTGESAIVNKFNLLSDKVHKIEEKLKNSSVNSSQKNLPKIDSIVSSNKNIHASLLEQLRKDMLKTNEQLTKTNEKVQTVKKSLQQLETAHHQIPKQIQKIEMDLHKVNEIQQNRLIDLIKDIINRVLTDPFNNNFTNVLKRQINAKFLQIKHEYSTIMKDIESKVMDRADVGDLQKLKDFVETNALQLRALMQKKAENQDFKKGVRYLDQKLKDLYSYVKDMEEEQTTNTRPQTQGTMYTRGFLRSKKQ